MKRLFGLFVIIFVASALSSNAAITGSKHDFSGSAWSSNSICGPCHTPHNSTAGAGPLWNHVSTTNTYTLYTSTTMSHAPSQPGPMSLACLSCHDGSVALDAFGATPGSSTTIDDINGGAAKVGGGNSLTSDHPIGITYDTSQSDGGFKDDSITSIPGDSSSKKVEDYLDGGSGGKVGCATCHDVHNTDANPSLLRGHNNNSSLCLACHNK